MMTGGETFRIGDAVVTRVEEVIGPAFKPEHMFPAFDAEVFRSRRAVMDETQYVAAKGRLIGSCHTWVIRLGDMVALVDTGIGNGKTRPGYPTWTGLDLPFLARLADTGVKPEEVTHVICTHLHVDHVGWNTVAKGDRWVPTFPNARYLFPRRDYDAFAALEAEDPENPNLAGCFADSVAPIVQHGLAVMIDDGHEEAGGALSWHAAYGHAPGQLAIRLRSKGSSALFTGDVMHAVLQVYETGWSTAFDTDRDQAETSRRRILAEVADTDTLVLPQHFGWPFGGRVVSTQDGFAFRFTEPTA